MKITIDIPDEASPYLNEVITKYNNDYGTSYTPEQYVTQTIKKLMRDEKIRQFHELETVKVEDATNKVSADTTERINTEKTRLETNLKMDSD